MGCGRTRSRFTRCSHGARKVTNRRCGDDASSGSQGHTWPMYPFRKLSVWRRAHALALQVHEATEPAFQRRRYWSLIDQMRRASISVAAKIAEGSGQVTSAQFAGYLTIALGSARELDYHVLLGRDLRVLTNSDYARLDARVDQVSRMLAVFRDRVAERAQKSAPRRRVHRISGPLTSHLPHPPSD
jgi:four helix bundle protein